MIILALGIIVISLIVYAITLANEACQYWKKKGIKHLKPVLFFGNSLPVVLNRKHNSEVLEELCTTYPDEPILGFYDSMMPKLVVQDPDYIERIFVKDFVHFTDHGVSVSEEASPIDAYQLFNMNGRQWRAFRYKLSPLFTSGKLKSMFQCMMGCGDNLIKFIDKGPRKNVDLREATALFSMDVIGSAAFGIDARVLDNPKSEFREMGRKIFQPGLKSFIKLWILTASPWLSKKLKIPFNNQEVVKYFCNIIGDTLKYREENGIHRNDFVQMMIQLKQKGKIEIANWDPNDDYLKDDNANDTDTFEITDTILMSQAFTFFSAGFDAISYTLVYALVELSQKQEIQTKVREEIQNQCKNDSKITYDALKRMVYLESTINETLRLHPAAPLLFRVCTKDYTFPNGYTIFKGEFLLIPTKAIFVNPTNHESPLEFKPERHLTSMNPGEFFPFGDGPRICIAMRLALLQLKYALARILLEYKVNLNPKTKLPIKMKPKSILNMPDEEVFFDIEKIN